MYVERGAPTPIAGVEVVHWPIAHATAEVDAGQREHKALPLREVASHEIWNENHRDHDQAFHCGGGHPDERLFLICLRIADDMIQDEEGGATTDAVTELPVFSGNGMRVSRDAARPQLVILHDPHVNGAVILLADPTAEEEHQGEAATQPQHDHDEPVKIPAGRALIPSPEHARGRLPDLLGVLPDQQGAVELRRRRHPSVWRASFGPLQ
mmetsp:Transcript_75073/g.217926  ORF Transcript_75073/g.217926 Transcript_75073/m.217926 type:complete len:210 (+) Transcript_75073:577-1206(+)